MKSIYNDIAEERRLIRIRIQAVRTAVKVERQIADLYLLYEDILDEPFWYGMLHALQEFEMIEVPQLTPYHMRKSIEVEYARRQIIKSLTVRQKKRILERDAYRCVQCKDWKNLQVDHIVARCNGGKTTPKNLQTLCEDCHKKKTKSDRWKQQK